MSKTNKSDLAHSLAEELNKKFKDDGQVAYFLDEDPVPTNISDWVSTGSTMLDLAISNRPHGGLPVGRIVEINGLESSGKSLVAAHALANVQKKGGVAVYIDTENALDDKFLRSIGVNTSEMIYAQMDTCEKIFAFIEQIIETVRGDKDNDKVVGIVFDSLAAASTNKEMEADFDKDGWATDKALIVSKAMRKITKLIGRERILLVITNQLRQKLNVMFGDPWTTSGGKALQFHSSVRIRLSLASKDKYIIKKGKLDETIGIRLNAKVIKNRVGPPFRNATFDVYFDRGIDDLTSWIDILKAHDIVKRSNPGFKITDHNGEERKFITEEWTGLLENDEKLKQHVYKQICELLVMKYKADEVNFEPSTETEVDDNSEKSEEVTK